MYTLRLWLGNVERSCSPMLYCRSHYTGGLARLLPSEKRWFSFEQPRDGVLDGTEIRDMRPQ